MRTAQVKTSRDGATARPRPVLSTLDAIAAHPSQRFSIAISGSLFVHALIFAGWLSSALLSKPEILELREISYIDETELPPEEKAPEQELEVEPGGTDAFDNSQPAVGRVTRARGTISASEAGSPLANGIPAGGGEPGPPAPNVEELGVLKVMEGVAEVAGVSSEPVLHIAGAGKFLTNGHGSRNGTDIGAAVLEGFATGNGDGRGYGNGVDGVFEGLKGEIGGTGVKLGKVGRVTIERIGRITGSKEATSGAGGRSEESLRQVMMDNMGRLQYLYTKYLKNGLEARGKVEVEVTISAEGKVTEVQILSSQIPIAAFQEELRDAIRRWKYQPIARGYMKVVYPMIFIKMS